MKFYASIAAGVCTIWLGIEPNPDQSSDPGTGFTPDFYRAMHMHKRGLCCHPVSVCLSVCHVRGSRQNE